MIRRFLGAAVDVVVGTVIDPVMTWGMHVVRDELDELAAAWVSTRAKSHALPRIYGQPLLEDLAEQLGAKLELAEDLG